MARQWYFWNLYRSGRGNLAAFPTPFAPHIRTGRFDHAIDFNNAAGVARAAARRGVTLRWTVRGESWHLEADRAELAHYYSKHNLPRTLELGNKGRAVLKLKKLMRARGLQDFPRGRKFDVNTRAAIKRFQARHNLKADGIVGPTTWRVLHG